jgi:hypothetical protein
MLNISVIAEITGRLRLECQPELLHCLQRHPELYQQVANGVGSDTSWTYHIIPDTIWGLDISPSAGIHDWDFTYPLYFEHYNDGMRHFHNSNQRFKGNVFKQIKAGSLLCRIPRNLRLIEYMLILEKSSISHNAFWSNKLLPVDWNKYHRRIPDFNPEKYSLNQKIIKSILTTE